MSSKETVVIELKKTSLKDGDAPWNYGHLMKVCLDAIPEKGWTTSVMRERLDVEAKIDLKKKTVELTPTEFTVLKDCVVGFAWGKKERELVEFEDYISSL